MEKNKSLVISMPEMHEDLLEKIHERAKQRKLTVSQYVRDLLYKSLADAAEGPAGMDESRTARAMAQGVRQSGKKEKAIPS